MPMPKSTHAQFLQHLRTNVRMYVPCICITIKNGSSKKEQKYILCTHNTPLVVILLMMTKKMRAYSAGHGFKLHRITWAGGLSSEEHRRSETTFPVEADDAVVAVPRTHRTIDLCIPTQSIHTSHKLFIALSFIMIIYFFR